MIQKLVDWTLIGLLGLLTLFAVFLSANGACLHSHWAIAYLFSSPAMLLSTLLVVNRICRERVVSPVIVGLIFVCPLLIISVGATQWPLRAHHAIFRNSFDSLAQRVRAGEQIQTPTKIGVVTVQRAELHGGHVYLLTSPKNSERGGLVQSSRDYNRFNYNIRTTIPLDRRWEFIGEE